MKPNIERALSGGTQRLWYFDNGYGASVVCHAFSYGGGDGLFEMAVLKGTGDDSRLCYDTPITDDVIGNLTEGGVQDLLAKIQALPNCNKV